MNQFNTQNPQEKEKRPASIGNPVIEAVVNGLFKFTEPHQLRTRLNQIREKFLISKDQDAANPDTIKLWIKGYALTDEEKGKGYLGNFAMVKPKGEGKHLSLIAEKLPIELKFHPRKKRPKLKHPDWGHPILRAVLKKKPYATLEEVQAEFANLHQEFPEVSIPGVDRLHIIVYQKGKGEVQKGNPVQKITLRLEVNEDGTYYMSYMLNKKKVQLPGTAKAAPGVLPAPGTGAVAEPKTNQGYFTAMALLKKKKPFKKPLPSEGGGGSEA